MSKIPKFRKNNWWDDEQEVSYHKPSRKEKNFDKALRARDIDFLREEDYDD